MRIMGAHTRNARADGMVLALTAVYLLNQVRHTWQRRKRWPFCSYDMFSYPLGTRFPQPRVQLLDDIGATEPMPVYGLLPVEFFRTVAILDEIFYECSDEALQDRFADRLLWRLNERPWRGFDEVRASVRPRTLTGWTGLRLLDVVIDLADYDAEIDGPLHDVQPFYSYRWAA